MINKILTNRNQVRIFEQGLDHYQSYLFRDRINSLLKNSNLVFLRLVNITTGETMKAEFRKIYKSVISKFGINTAFYFGELVNKWEHYGKSFHHSTEWINRNTGLGNKTQIRVREELVKANLITVEYDDKFINFTVNMKMLEKSPEFRMASLSVINTFNRRVALYLSDLQDSYTFNEGSHFYSKVASIKTRTTLSKRTQRECKNILIEAGLVKAVKVGRLTYFSVNEESISELDNKCYEERVTKRAQEIIAKEKKCVVTGSLLIKENNSYYNRLIWMNTDGNYQKYDKRHLFRPAKEHIYSSKGNKKLIVETKGWKIRPLVCYDLRFPVWSKNTFTDIYEYDCLIYIANWPKHKNYHWKSLLIARAIENQSYIIGVNRIGIDGNKVPFSGYSMVINPKGKIISKTKSDTESIETIELSKYKMENYRKQFTVALDWDKFKII